MRLLRTWAAAVLSIGACRPAQAAQIPWLHDIFDALAKSGDRLTTHVDAAIASAQVAMVVNVLFGALALALFVWRFAGFALRGFDLAQVAELLVHIGVVYLLLQSYRALMPALASAGRFISAQLAGVLAGDTGGASLAEAAFTTLLQISLVPSCDGDWLSCMSPFLTATLITMLGDIALLAVGLLATVVEIWMQWCFEIVFAVGWLTVPFLLYRPLAFVFDGWLRLFYSVLMYDLVAKLVLAMVLAVFHLMDQFTPGAMGATIEVRKATDLAALFVFLAIGFMMLATTGRMSEALAAGSPRVSGLLSELARSTGKAAAAW